MKSWNIGATLALISVLAGGCHAPTQEELAKEEATRKTIALGVGQCNKIMEILESGTQDIEKLKYLRKNSFRFVIASTQQDPRKTIESTGIAFRMDDTYSAIDNSNSDQNWKSKNRILPYDTKKQIAEVLTAGELAGCTFYPSYLGHAPNPMYFRIWEPSTSSQILADSLNGGKTNFSDKPK